MNRILHRSILKRLVLFHALTGCVLILLACSPGMSEQQMLQNARSHLDKGDLRAASIELRNTLQENADNAEARFLLGSISMKIGDFASAEKEFRRAAQAGWQQEEVQIEIARALLAQREFQKLLDEIKPDDSWSKTGQANLMGLRALAEASMGDNSSAKATLAEGNKYNKDAFHILKNTAAFQLADIIPGDARKTLKKALSNFKDNPELLMLSAATRLQDKDVAGAAGIYQQVIKQDRTSLITANGRRARIGLARTYIIEGKLDQARTTLEPLYKRNENDPEANYLGGLIAFEQANYNLAEDHIRKLLKLAPDHHLSQQLMGKIKFALKDYDQAAQYLSSYLNVVPDDLAVRKLLASTYIALHQPKQARMILQPALSKNPEDTGTLQLMSKLELSEGNVKAGIDALQKAVDADPENLTLRKQLIVLFISVGETKQALTEIHVFKEISKNTQEANKLMIAAHLKANQYQEAIEIANSMLKDDPKNPAVLSIIGGVYATSGNKLKARRYYKKALQLEKDQLSASLGLAELERKEGNIKQAIEIYQGLVQSGNGGTAPMLALAALSEQQGRKDEMINWLEKARESAPGEIKPRVILAKHYLNNGQAEKAELVIKETINIAPLNAEILALQGRILMTQQRYNEALPPLNKLVNNIPESAHARALLGETYARLGMLKDAHEHLDKALDIQPDLALALGLMAEIALKNNKKDISLSYAKRLQRVLPDLYLGYKLEGQVWMSRQDFTRANIAFKRAWEKQQSAELAISLFNTAIISSDIHTALQPILSWLNEHPDDIATRFFLATAYQENNQNNEAIREYQRVLDRDPGNAAALNNLAWLYFIAGDSRAQKLAERAYQSAPDNPGIQDTYGWILLKQGQVDKGHRLIKQALEQLPETLEIRYHYAVALLKSGNRKQGGEILGKLLDEGKPFSGRKEAERLLVEYSAEK